MMMEKNQIPAAVAAAVWLDREKVPIKMFPNYTSDEYMFKNYRAIFRFTLLTCTAD